MIDGTKIGTAAAELMERVERDHPAGELVDVLVIAEVELRDADGGSWAAYRWAGSSGRSSVDAGLCAQALEGLTAGDRIPPELEPPDDA